MGRAKLQCGPYVADTWRSYFCSVNSDDVGRTFGALSKPVSGAFANLRKASISFIKSVCPSVCLSVCLSAWNNSTPTVRIFMKFGI